MRCSPVALGAFMSFAGFCGSARDREAKLGLLRRDQRSCATTDIIVAWSVSDGARAEFLAKPGGRASVAAAGFSRKWQHALRSKLHSAGRDSMRAAALIYHKVPTTRCSKRAHILGKPLLQKQPA